MMGLLYVSRLFRFIFYTMFPIALQWRLCATCLVYVIRPWSLSFWFCLNICVSFWRATILMIKTVMLLPMQMYRYVKKQVHLNTEYQQRNKVLEEEMKRVISECKKLKQMLKDSEATRNNILKKYGLLQLQVAILEEENNSLRLLEERASKSFHDSNENDAAIVRRQNEDWPPDKLSNDLLLQHLNLDTTNHKQNQFDSAKMKSGVHEPVLSSCMFSVLLSLLVGLIVWLAQEPCTPLVVSVFIISCGSWKVMAESVLALGRGVGLEGVALLNFNWFILGSLAYPVLPIVGSTVVKFVYWFFRSFGVFCITEKIVNIFF